MNKISDLIEKSKALRKQEEEAVKKQINRDLQSAAENFGAELKGVFNTIISDLKPKGTEAILEIASHCQKILYWILAIMAVPVFVSAMMAWHFTGKAEEAISRAEQAKKNMEDWKKSADIYQQQSKNMHFANCTTDQNNNSVPCVETDQSLNLHWGNGLVPVKLYNQGM